MSTKIYRIYTIIFLLIFSCSSTIFGQAACCPDNILLNPDFETGFTSDINFPFGTGTNNANYGDFSNWSYDDGSNPDGAYIIDDPSRASVGDQFAYIEDFSTPPTYNQCIGNGITYTTSGTCATDRYYNNTRYIVQFDFVAFNRLAPAGGIGQTGPRMEHAFPATTDLYDAAGNIASNGTPYNAVAWADVATSWISIGGVTPMLTGTNNRTLWFSNHNSATAGMLIDNTYFAQLSITDGGISGTTCGTNNNQITFDLNPTSNVPVGVPNIIYNVSAPAGYTISPTQGNYNENTTFTLTINTGNFSSGTPANIDLTITDDVNTNCPVIETVTNPYPCNEISDAGLTVGPCDNQGTEIDATDDTFTFSLNPTGIGLGATYNVSGDVTASGISYGSATTFDNSGSGFLISGGDLSITITDVASGMTLPVTINTPATCSDDLDIDCDNVGDSIDPDDGNPCSPYPCTSTCDFSTTENITFSTSGGNTTGGTVLYILTDANGTIVETAATTNFAAQANAGFYYVYILAYESAATPINTATGNDILNVDFAEAWACYDLSCPLVFEICEPILGTIGNYVWIDENSDGFQDEGEPGIPNVTVQLSDGGGTPITTLITDQDGGYLFTDLDASNYTVQVIAATLPNGLTQTSNPINANTDLGNQTQSYAITLGSGDENLTADFGYNWGDANGNAGLGALGDYVWIDNNGDGIQDASEIGIPNVTVSIYSDSNADGFIDPATDALFTGATDKSGNTGTGITTTGTDGSYLFHSLPAGAYVVVVDDSTLPGGSSVWAQTGDPDERDVTATNPDHLSEPIIIAPGDTWLNADFGYLSAGLLNAVGDKIYLDTNVDGSYTAGEEGIPGVTVTLLDASDNPIATTKTDANGDYLFGGLPDGTYGIWVTDTDNVLEGLTQTGDPDATLDDQSSIALAGGITNLNQDFGYTPSDHTSGDGAIGDLVYIDFNNDGVPNSSEGVEGVEVCLHSPIAIYDAGVDVTSDGLVNNSDDGFASGYEIINGRIDINADGAVDGLDDGTIQGIEVINGWFDMDGNGLVDAANKPIDNGYIGDVKLACTKTDENGNYYFGNLDPAGDYVVVVDETTLPGTVENFDDPDSANVTESQSYVDLNVSGPVDLDQDFGYRSAGTLGSVGTLVWEDRNADGNVDAGEDGIEAVSLDLYWDVNGNGLLDVGEPKLGSTLTDANGDYLFENLPVDGGVSYIVDVTDTQNKLTGYWHSTGANNTNDNSQTDAFAVTLSTGTPDIFYADFGYYIDPAAVGNFVWFDVNRNGLQDSGEPVIGNAVLTLEIDFDGNATTDVTLNTLTDATGYYAFNNLLLDEDYNGAVASPSYTISAATPVGYDGITIIDAGGNSNDLLDSDDPDGVTAFPIQGLQDVALTNTSGTEASYDFGFIIGSGSIGNFVWMDENGDGYQDIGEPGIANVNVVLYDSGNNPIGTLTTDANGGYLFTNLLAGDYTVAVDPTAPSTLPSGVTQTTLNNAGGDFGNQTANYAITLAAGEENLTADFGYNYGNANGNTGTGALGDQVWIDANGDGIHDNGEPGVGGITVTIYSDSDGDGYVDPNKDAPFTPAVDQNGNTGTGTTTTNSDGTYIFHTLPTGQYVVVVDDSGLPGGAAAYTQTGDPDERGTTATMPDNESNRIIIAPGDAFLNADFGYQPNSPLNTIGDLIWLDSDADGVADAGEPGFEGVTVTLLNASGDIVANMITDENGNYLFEGLPDGTYTVFVNDTYHVLDRFDQTGDPDATMDDQSTVAVSGGTTNLLQDFGYVPVGHGTLDGLIGDIVFLDQNSNGQPDAGEGIEGVEVLLLDGSANILFRTTTDENGNYYFGGLDANNYVVEVNTSTLPPGVTNTTDPDAGTLNESNVTLGAGAINLIQDFGYEPTSNPGTIGTLVWEDTNADGNVAAGEDPIEGVTIDLYWDVDGDGLIEAGEPLVGSTVTAADGTYLFENLPTSGGVDYVVAVTDEDSKLDGYWHSAGTNGLNNNSQIPAFPVSIGGADPVDEVAGDFGYYNRSASVGNFVWEDVNMDGAQSPGEPGIEDAIVTLTIDYPNGATLILTDTTDATGHYSFENLLLDEDYNGDGIGTEPTFEVTFAVPSGYASTTTDANGNTNDLVDSDDPQGTIANPIQGRIGVAQNSDPNAEEAEARVDFGIISFALPVDLTSFEGHPVGCKVQLRWRAESEENFDYYQLEHSTDGNNYEVITRVMAAGGSNPQVYQYLHEEAVPNNYYRLKMVDHDETFEYSNVLVVNTGCGELDINEMTLYPNPVGVNQSVINVKFYSEALTTKILVLNAAGKIVKMITIDVEPGWNSLRWDISDLPSGTYFMSRRDGAKRETKPFVIQE